MEIGAIFTTAPTLATWLLIYIMAQRLAELAYAGRNTRRLLSEGGTEFGADHYHWFIILHGAWLAVIILLVDPLRELDPVLLALFIGTQVLRLWTLVSIGRWWTTRIISAPHFDRVRRGSYKYIRHPNYLVVVLEVAIVPLLMDLPSAALLFTILNAILLRHRIGVENEVLAKRGVGQTDG